MRKFQYKYRLAEVTSVDIKTAWESVCGFKMYSCHIDSLHHITDIICLKFPKKEQSLVQAAIKLKTKNYMKRIVTLKWSYRLFHELQCGDQEMTVNLRNMVKTPVNFTSYELLREAIDRISSKLRDPHDAFDSPITENQEYGWISPPQLNLPLFPRRSCDITQFQNEIAPTP
jgi:hypothetical protein